MDLLLIYKTLLKAFGKQNWWPAQYFKFKKWEIAVGAVLTQNTAWKNVKKALKSMSEHGITTPEDVLRCRNLHEVIRSAGYYRQKSERLRALAKLVIEREFNLDRMSLLNVKGIGKETADSILLYACNQLWFVIDAYTKRILSRLGFDAKDYDEWQRLFHKNLPKDLQIYKEFHALLVELAKKFCKKEPACKGCPLRRMCKNCKY